MKEKPKGKTRRLTAVRCSVLLGVIVRTIRPYVIAEFESLTALCNRGREQSAGLLLGNSIQALSSALAFLNPFLPHRERKRIPAWFCGDTFLISRPECTHPESEGDASAQQLTPAQANEVCD